MSDYHLHFHPHGPAEKGPSPEGRYPLGLVEQYVESAAARGVAELAFTEHLYRCVESADVLGRWWDGEDDPAIAASTEHRVTVERFISLERYVDLVLRAKEAGLPVLLGLEVDFFPETFDAVLEFLDPYPWDVLIGSVHWIGGWHFDQRGTGAEWDRRGERRVYEEYFGLKTRLAATGAMDVLAHPDRCKLTGRRPAEEPVDLYTALVAAAASTGVAVEVSSAGLRQPAGEIYPAPTLLRMAREAGLDITLASDAHRPEQAGWKTNEIRAAALAAGFTHTARFAARRRSLVPLTLTEEDDTPEERSPAWTRP
jgi:histidinol-phosphatase (PHP family)